uniref:Uncharacterized protein n=1 Tax=Polytomella parva TaxID=51329 RepID=A0A7S0UMS7_9CHLO
MALSPPPNAPPPPAILSGAQVSLRFNMEYFNLAVNSTAMDEFMAAVGYYVTNGTGLTSTVVSISSGSVIALLSVELPFSTTNASAMVMLNQLITSPTGFFPSDFIAVYNITTPITAALKTVLTLDDSKQDSALGSNWMGGAPTSTSELERRGTIAGLVAGLGVAVTVGGMLMWSQARRQRLQDLANNGAAELLGYREIL